MLYDESSVLQSGLQIVSGPGYNQCWIFKHKQYELLLEFAKREDVK